MLKYVGQNRVKVVRIRMMDKSSEAVCDEDEDDHNGVET